MPVHRVFDSPAGPQPKAAAASVAEAPVSWREIVTDNGLDGWMDGRIWALTSVAFCLCFRVPFGLKKFFLR